MNARKIHIWACIDLVTPGSLYCHRRKKWHIQSIISGLGFLRNSVEYVDGWLLTRKPQITWRAQVWVYSFGQMKLMSRSWSQSQVLGLFAITLYCAKITAHVILQSFLKCDRSPFPSIPGLLLKHHPEDSGMTFWESTVIPQLFLLCLSGEGVTRLVA